ncbi:hypothetical protein BV22DRAFT_1198606 [Leucogyrophana mollusca]|uniref:Uncharacterized protein n=1 Tax=Leucogyrophana mollusca TaxID=85980 RepID=A0ACB8B5E4_9AGAM|nr:hypothetical protein BV22DRAFT_1198606 [Leucogyrophana mollusca]
MASGAAKDFLTKELFINKNPVTFRSLSRQLGIHVNDAKNELANYYAEARGSDSESLPFPTYLVSGEVAPDIDDDYSNSTQDYLMDVDDGDDEDDRKVEQDVVKQTKILLVEGGVLEDAKSQFSRIFTAHIYSLSPSRLRDAGLICGPSDSVRSKDAKSSSGELVVLGKVVGGHVKRRTGTRAGPSGASSSKTKLDVAQKAKAPPPVKVEVKEKLAAPKPEAKEKIVPPESNMKEKPAPAKPDAKEKSGRLDWSKAKSKDADASIKTKAAVAPSKSKGADVPSKPKPADATGKPAQDTKDKNLVVGPRGTKRKSPAASVSDSEDQGEVSTSRKHSPEASTSAKLKREVSTRIKKGVVLSDDDDDNEAKPTRRPKPKPKPDPTSDSEASLRAMMDIDDDQVIKASRFTSKRPLPEEEEESEEDSSPVDIPPSEPADSDVNTPKPYEDDSDEDAALKPKTKKKTAKKSVPVGRNGLKKRRVVKTRTAVDAKGYMQTEDYSSYESVDEDDVESEADVAARDKGKGKKKSPGESKPEKTKAEKPKLEIAPSKAKTSADAPPKTKTGASSSRGAGAGAGSSSRGAKAKATKRGGGLLNFFGPEKGKK